MLLVEVAGARNLPINIFICSLRPRPALSGLERDELGILINKDSVVLNI